MSDVTRLFDEWSRNGRDESMQRGHRGATGSILDGWQLDAHSVVLDVGCGNGWALRWALERGAGRGIGVDLSPGMVQRARELGDAEGRLRFEQANATALALDDASVTHVLSVENLYYIPDPAKALAEWARVCRPGGQLGIMVDLYAEHPSADNWVPALQPVKVHVFTEAQLRAMVAAAGFSQVSSRRFVDETRPVKSREEFEPSPWDPTYETYLAGKRAGSLVVEAIRSAP